MELRTQYRMCGDIMAIANELTYRGRLRCGSPLVEHGMLSLTGSASESAPGWLRQASRAPPLLQEEPPKPPCLLEIHVLPCTSTTRCQAVQAMCDLPEPLWMIFHLSSMINFQTFTVSYKPPS